MTIELDKMRENALTGIRRAALFMGFAVNCSDNPELNNFELTQHSYLHFLPDNISQERINEIKYEYKGWVIFNAIRELTDSFEFYLFDLFKNMYHADIVLNGSSNISEKDLRQFDGKGLEQKIQLMKEKKQIEPSCMDSIISIQKVRNCITHRRGFVKEKDCNDKNQLIVKWIAPDIFIISKDHKIRIDYPIIKPYVVNEGEQLVIEYSSRTKTFQLAEYIEFDVKDLAEICLYFNNEIDKIHKACIKYFKMLNANFIEHEEIKAEFT